VNLPDRRLEVYRQNHLTRAAISARASAGAMPLLAPGCRE
jgi:hypothetical protein